MISGRGGQCLSSVAAGRPCDRLRTLGRADGGERTQQETLAERAGASWRGRSVVRWVAQAPALLDILTGVSGVELSDLGRGQLEILDLFPEIPDIHARLIAAEAVALDAPLVTKNGALAASAPVETVW